MQLLEATIHLRWFVMSGSSLRPQMTLSSTSLLRSRCGYIAEAHLRYEGIVVGKKENYFYFLLAIKTPEVQPCVGI